MGYLMTYSIDHVTSEQMAQIKGTLSQPVALQRKVFNTLDLDIGELDAADDIIDDIDDDTWIAVVSIQCGGDNVFAAVQVEVWGQGGGHITGFFGFFATRNAVTLK
jgi:hypothetical protein